MANETSHLQFVGRQGGLSEQDIQAQGRSFVYVAGGVEPNREPAGETDATAMSVADYPAPRRIRAAFTSHALYA